MGATEMTAIRTGRFSRIAAIVAGLAAALMLLAGAQAQTAAAGDVVGNPGTFTVTWGDAGSDGFRWAPNHLNESKFPISEMNTAGYQVNVDANGNITPVSYPNFAQKEIYSDCLTGAFLCIGAPKGVKSTPQAGNNGAWTGTINPTSGLINLSMPMRVRMESVSGSSISDCYLTPIAINPSTSKSGGVAYNFNTGAARVTDSGFNTPYPGGAGGGGGSSNCGRTNDYPGVGLASTDTHAYISMTFQNGSGQGVRPWPVRPAFNITPDPVGVGQTATFNASASVIDNGVKTCANPSPSEPGCGYRWDFDNNGTDDAVTNGPTVTHQYSSAGTKTAKLTVFDTQGKSEPVTDSVVVQTLPLAQVDSGPPTTRSLSSSFTFSIPTNPYGATTQCSVDGGSWSACSSGSSFNFSQADDTSGSHNFRVRGITPGGVIGPADTYSFTIDRVYPRVTFDPQAVPADPTNETSATLEFTADKAGSDLLCQLDGGPWESCGSSSSGTVSYSGLGESPNPHVVKVRAIDPLGNDGGGSNAGGGEFQWEVDLSKPTLSFDQAPANPDNDVTPNITWINGEPIQTALCRLNRGIGQGAWTSCNTLTSHQLGLPTALQDGQYTFQVRTRDVAGNWGDVTGHTWTIDTNNPDVEIVKAPPSNSGRTAAFFHYDYNAGIDARCQLDSEAVLDPCTADIGTSPADATMDRGKVGFGQLAVGAHTFTVTVEDTAGNTTSQVYTWSVKTSVPSLALNPSSLPANPSTSADASIEFATANGDAECRIDGAPFAPCDSSTEQAYTGLSDGAHTFEARAVDETGRVSAVASHAWQVLQNAPQVSFTQNPAAKVSSTSATFGFNVDTADSDAEVVCILDGATVFDCASPTSVTALADGSHTMEITATDAAGQTDTASHTWEVKAKVPEASFSATPAAISNSAAANFQFGSDEGGTTFTCQLDGGSWDPCTSPVNKTGLGQGSHTFAIRGSDDVGNTGQASYTWKVDTVAPSVTVSSRPDASTENLADLVEFSASESPVSYSCTVDGNAVANCGSPLLVKNLAIGAHTVEIQATDQAGNTGAKATVQWTVTKRTAPQPTSLRAAAVCPARAGSSCVVRLQGVRAGKAVTSVKRVRVRKGAVKKVNLKVRDGVRPGAVSVRQRIKAKGGRQFTVRRKGRVIGA